MPTSTLLIPIVSAPPKTSPTPSWPRSTRQSRPVAIPIRSAAILKISDLFTENGGTRMHRETRIALAAVTLSRLTQS